MDGKLLVVHKKRGQTPLECIHEIKKEHPEWKHIPMTYAGRLDPLAKGVLLVLIGDECLKKDEYMALPKEYEVTILFGFATDTYDVMGKIVKVGEFFPSLVQVWRGVGGEADSSEVGLPKLIEEALSHFTGRITQAYPPYSSRTVAGKPLFQWAREGKLAEITIPSHDVSVENITIVSQKMITGEALNKKIIKDISSVVGDFRQQEILEMWKDILADKKDTTFQTVTATIRCSSGVYVRSIANDLGKMLGIPALALDIVRTKIGEFK